MMASFFVVGAVRHGFCSPLSASFECYPRAKQGPDSAGDQLNEHPGTALGGALTWR
jgi:hypothetical protein